MAISDKDRRSLWGRSGNRCAICRRELVKSNPNNVDYNIGEECHIVSSKATGPRHESGWENYDNYDNLILLCRNHHKEIDDCNNISLYPKSRLHKIKAEHELWVKETLSGDEQSDFVKVILSGAELFNVLSGALKIACETQDAVTDKESAAYIGTISQSLVEYLDICSDLDPANVSLVELELQELLEEMIQKGYLLYGNRSSQVVKNYDGSTEKWPVAVFKIVICEDALRKLMDAVNG